MKAHMNGARVSANEALYSPVDESLTHPPRPRWVLRVGIMGQRGDQPADLNPVSLQLILQQILDSLKVAAVDNQATAEGSRGQPVLRLISPLADRVDCSA